MVKGVSSGGKLKGFAPTPWTMESAEWQAIDQRLPADHLARRVARAVERLDLTRLVDSYWGVGKKALRPDLLLMLVLYELRSNRPSPAQWVRDARENEALRWLLLGLEPSRSRLYDFRDRVAPLLPAWHAQVLQQAVEEKLTRGERAALDSSSVAAHSARRNLLNEERLGQRQKAIEDRLARLARGEMPPAGPCWLGRTAAGLRGQKQRYQRAAAVLRERLAANAQRRACDRKPRDKVLVSPSDPEAILARDKLGVFRPLYNVQLVRDLDSPLVLAYDVLAQRNDNGVLEPLVECMADHVGRKPDELLVDAGYVSLQHLEFCAAAGITLYGPVQENDFSSAKDKKPQSNQYTELPKSAFRWLLEERTFQCPEGHRLRFTRQITQERAAGAVTLDIYTCPPQHCLNCPRQAACTRTPRKGRSVSRMHNEELVDALRVRMQTEEARRLYRLRSQTVELNYADLKEHRGLRRFHARGRPRVAAEIGLLILTHNLLCLESHRHRLANSQENKSPQTLSLAQKMRRSVKQADHGRAMRAWA
jgi:transposase